MIMGNSIMENARKEMIGIVQRLVSRFRLP
jgi:hypothetical protein